MSLGRSPWTWVAIVGAAILAWIAWPANVATAGLRNPPSFPPLEAGELAHADDRILLDLIQRECLRRLSASGKDVRAAGEVLSPPAHTLWVIASLERDIRDGGFTPLLRLERDARQTPLWPPLHELADAYADVGQAQAAEVVREASGLLERSPTDSEADERRLSQALIVALGRQGSAGPRLAFARRHLRDLFPAL